MICPNCGKQLQDGALFCTKCGSKMNVDSDVGAYVTENEYRMCGFSGSSQAARSYEEFLESNP